MMHKNITLLVLIGALWPLSLQAQEAMAPDAPVVPAQEEGLTYEAYMASLPDTYRSTMFYDDELDKIQTVIDAIVNQQPLPEEPKEEEPEEPEEPEPEKSVTTLYTYPQFYLTSIMYHTPKDWAIWVNHRKITSDKQHVIPGLTIGSLTRHQVNFIYDFSRDSQVSVQSDTADPKIKIDMEKRNVAVTLEPNQTFSLYSWQIYEGDVPTVSKTIAPIKDEQPAEPDSALESFIKGVEGLGGESGEEAGEAPAPQEDESREKKDIGSLLNQYKNLGGEVNNE